MRLKLSLSILCVLFSAALSAQLPAVGQWREHLPYRKTIALAEAGNRIWCATPYALFYFDKSDNSINRINKTNGLSDIGISHIAWNRKNQTLVVAYSNANIDLIKGNSVINISDIYRKPLSGNKTINRITEKGDSMLLACGFGVVVLNVKKREITDTWIIGPSGTNMNITDIDYNDSLIYASTPAGIYYASVKEPYLVSFTKWQKDTLLPYPTANYNLVKCFGDYVLTNISNESWYSDTMYVLQSGSWSVFQHAGNANRKNIRVVGKQLYVVYIDGAYIYDSILQPYYHLWSYQPGVSTPLDALADKDSIRWIADAKLGLVKSENDWTFTPLKLQGPYSPSIFGLTAADNSLWLASGGVGSSWGNQWYREGVSALTGDDWNFWSYENTPALDTIVDFLCAAIDPFDENHVFVGTWGRGLLEFKNKQLHKVYSPQNSSLQYSVNDPKWFGVAGMSFDEEGNLWCASSANPMALHRRKPDGTWKAFSLSPLITDETMSQMVIDDFGQKWIVIARGHGILVYNDNETPDYPYDDLKKKLGTAVGNGELPTTMVNCIARDLDGEIWVGTDKGIAVFFNPGNVFTSSNFDAQRIFIEQDGKTQYLLEFEKVTAIAVDGANRKWIGTQKAGVFLMSADGTKEIEHFTTENSPLFSDQINAISINQKTGEVFFGTDKGLISYRGTATRGNETHTDVLVFPNPVREGYNGYISVKGLVNNASVKITDISGGLVYQTTALGGQAVWNGKKFNGDKVNTGVYLVFSSNADGSETLVSKILFIK